MKRTIILGAGFSRAISSSMPLTDELGTDILDWLRLAGKDLGSRPYSGIGFEAWLSRLAEPQPDLTTPENLRNRTLFAEISAKMWEVLVQRQLTVVQLDLPWWLQRFVGTLHYGRTTTVATFNYDQLLELALQHSRLRDIDNNQVTAESALRYGPAHVYQSPTGLTFGSPVGETFQILKLHGSVDSFWVPDDTTGVSINRWDSQTRWYQTVFPSDEKRRQLLPGREPFLIPPAAAKSTFYNNPVTRELWHQASKALGESKEVHLVGYSIPMTDLVTTGMLTDQLRKSGANVTIVNPVAKPVKKALRAIGVKNKRISVYDDPDPCPAYVTDLERGFKPSWTYPHVTTDLNLGAAYGSHVPEATITKITGCDSDGVVQLEASEPHDHTAPTPVTLFQFKAAAAGHPSPRARITWPNGNTSYVARTDELDPQATARDWLLLRPTAMPFKRP